MALSQSVLLPFVIFIITFPHVLTEEILGVKDDEFDFDGLPGVQHELRVEVEGGGIECFYQSIKEGASLHVSFEVLKGADLNIDFTVKNPKGDMFAKHLWTNEGTIDQEVKMPGIYEICLDNSFSRFSTKLVFLYLVTYAPVQWENYSKEIEEVEKTVGNFTESVKKVDLAINKMHMYQGHSRKHLLADWYLSLSNQTLVRNWSILMSCLMVTSSVFQVYFVRRLFRTQNVTPTSKPRA